MLVLNSPGLMCGVLGLNMDVGLFDRTTVRGLPVSTLLIGTERGISLEHMPVLCM